jgi:CTP-dependent riboflavin kinase
LNRLSGFRGRIVSGRKEAAFFTGLDWVVEQCRRKLAFVPWPGTLNLVVDRDLGRQLAAAENFLELSSPTPEFCSARVLPAVVEGIRAAVIIPEKEVRVHGDEIIEILAPVNLRQALDRRDNDPVSVTLVDFSDHPANQEKSPDES